MVRKGDPILPALTAEFFNDTERRNKAYGIGGINPDSVDEPNYIYIRNTTTTAFSRFSPVGLGTLQQAYASHSYNSNNLLFNSAALSESKKNSWAVLQEPLEGRVGAIALAIIIGRSWVRVPSDYVADSPYLDVVGTVITGATQGKAAVLAESVDGSNKIVFANLGTFSSSSAIYNGKTPSGGIAAITSGGQMSSASIQRYKANNSGLLSIVSGKFDTVFNPAGKVSGSAWITYGLTADGIYEVLVEHCTNLIVSS